MKAQAKAQLKMAQAAGDPTEATYQRNQNLFRGKVISARDFDTAADIYGGNQAVVTAERANVDRLEAQKAFKIIRLHSMNCHCALYRYRSVRPRRLGNSTFSHGSDFASAGICAWPRGWRRRQRPKMKPCTSRQGDKMIYSKKIKFPVDCRGIALMDTPIWMNTKSTSNPTARCQLP